MTPHILLMHAYSAKNRGDGLLVDESLALLRKTFGSDVKISMLASDPQSFDYLGIPVYRAKPGKRGWSLAYLRVLQQLHNFDLLVGVGGGYLRAGHPIEMLKCLLVMGPQIIAAGCSRTPSVYLPQSIGPFRFGSRPLFRQLVRRISSYMLRDDRSMEEIALPQCVRLPDLAITSPDFTESLQRNTGTDIDSTVILTARAVRGVLPPTVKRLARLLQEHHIHVVGYVQSAIGGNDDTAVQQELTGPHSISASEYLRYEEQPARVVVAVRLHAALMALKAGHFVIHLAYERKGFSAFEDLGLSEWVHNVNSVDPEEVLQQVTALVQDEHTRQRYRQQLQRQRQHLEHNYQAMVDILTTTMGATRS